MSDTVKTEKLPFNPSVGNVDSQFIEAKAGDRMAKCTTCGRMSKSSKELPFFNEKPQEIVDGYYCGCRGWD